MAAPTPKKVTGFWEDPSWHRVENPDVPGRANMFQPREEPYGPPPDWDYRTAVTGFEGEALPPNAIGWTPDGEPYYGFGRKAIIGRTLEWGRRAWDRINRPMEGEAEEKPTSLVGKASALVRPLGEGGEEDKGKKPGILNIAARVPGEAIRGLGEGLSAGAAGIEQVAWGVSQAGRDVEESPLPDVVGKLEEVTPEARGIPGIAWTERGVLSDLNKAAREAYFTINPAFAAYNALRLIASPLSVGQKRDLVSDNIAAARIAYSAWTDTALREEFIRRYNEGEDPYLLELELDRPGAELVGQFIFDPLWLASGWISKPERAASLLRGSQVPKELRPFVEAVAKADEITKATKIEELANARHALVTARRGEALTKMTQEVTLRGLNAQGKRYVTGKVVKDFLDFVFGTNRGDPQGAMELLEALVRSVSDDALERTAGVAHLMHDEDLAHLWLSQDATDTALYLRRMLENEDGVVDAASFLNRVNAAKTVDEQLEIAARITAKSLEASFPTVTDMSKAVDQVAELTKAGKPIPAHLQRAAEAAEAMPDWKRSLAAFDSVAQSKFYQPVNKFFSTIYMGYNPGYAFRNMFTNYFHMFIDEPGSVGKSVHSLLSGNPLRGAVGRAEDSAMQWLDMLGKPTVLEQGLTQTKGVVRGAKGSGPTANLADYFEKNGGASVYSKSVEKSMRSMLQPGRALPTMTALINSGMDPRSASYLAKLVLDNYGDVKKAGQAFRAAVGTGSIDAWKTMSWLDPSIKRFMEQMYGGGDSLWATVQRSLADVKTPEDVKAALGSILKEYKREAAKAARQGVPLNLDRATMDGMDSAIELAISESRGVLPSEAHALWTNIKQADHLAVTKYLEMLGLTGPEGARVAETLGKRWNQASRTSQRLAKRYGRQWEEMLAKAGKKTLKGSPEAQAFWGEYTARLINEVWKPAIDEITTAAEQYAADMAARGAGGNIDHLLSDARDLTAQADLWHRATWENGKWVVDRKALIAPAVDFMPPSPAQTIAQLMPDIEKSLKGMEEGILALWGQKVPVMADEATEAALKAWEKQAASRVTEARYMAKKVADAQRKFTLLSYPERHGFDAVLGYLYPYQFWYSRTYVNWMKRLADNPIILSQYAKYRRTLEEVHSGAPDWWKYQINTNELLGLDAENPLFFNLEATLNPLNGMTGVDFYDAKKRGTWYENLLDDMGKFGPSTWTPYATALAVAGYMRGDEEAAARWGGRLFPQTATAKSLLGLLRHKVSDLPLQGEYDPFIHLFSGGMDPYERTKVGRTLGALVDDGAIDPATARDAAYTHSGDAWDMALDRAVNEKAWGQLGSQMLGVGFKARSQADLEIDQFWSDYSKLWTMEPNLSPEEFKQAMADLKTAYPFADAVLISRKDSLARDRAYAYSVMGDIPPSMGDDFAEWAGIPRDLWNKFYDDKGGIDLWSPSDRQRFMAGILDIAAVIDVPDEATKQGWLDAKARYSAVERRGESLFGDDIWTRVDVYYGAMGDTPADQARADAILLADPEINEALRYKAEMVSTDPVLFPYYASMSQIEKYWRGMMYADIEEKTGMTQAEIGQSWDGYWLALPGAERRAYMNEHPELGVYNDTRDAWQPIIDEKVVEFGSKLRDIPIDVREGVVPQVLGMGGQSVLEGVQNQGRGFPQYSWQEWEGILGDSLARLVLDNAARGDAMPDAAARRLDDIAEEMGLPSGDAALMLATQSVQAP